MVQASYQSLVEFNEVETAASSPAERDGSPPRGEDDQKLTLRGETSRDIARWLFDVVFSSYDEVHGDTEADVDFQAAKPQQNEGAIDRKGVVAPPGVAPKSINPTVVVDELLAEWTALSNEEITGVAAGSARERQTRPEAAENSQAEEGHRGDEARAHEIEPEVEAQGLGKPPLHFKDAVGRRFEFPFHLVQSWPVSANLPGCPRDVYLSLNSCLPGHVEVHRSSVRTSSRRQ